MKNSEKQKEELKARSDLAYKNLEYSTHRVDLLIISIGGAGVYVCLETLKSILVGDIYVSKDLIKFAGFFFILSIALNFLSQYTGKKANYFDYLMCKATLRKKKKDAIIYDKLSDKWDKWTTRLNSTSMVTLFIGLALLLLFFIGSI